MSAGTILLVDRVRSLTDAILDRARETNPDVGLTILVGGEAADLLRSDEEMSETCAGTTRLYRGVAVAVVSTLPSWLVMAVPVISALAPDVMNPASFYGDLRSNTFTNVLPSRL
ncbi:hypothetical protein [Rathayibacter sp. VKM Ac-2927]|uniref:hypothetical protein n=1 Tax=Rathayibacter sp. VKM Ac-2927 TaxID=2929478 RepID=UPI001FB51553|nr:hypothetical protein [Rathayibacter sp. VKM Ac-2927]MCJ1688620.1 hypothetical protein [Rathayibacter sp. VKM Ac-2927]